MGFIANLFVREDRFAVLLEAASMEVQATVKALDQLLTSPNPALSLASFVQARAKEQEIKGQIDTLLCQRGASRLDHGDLVALALGLNRISKTVRRFAERHMLCAAHVPSGIFAAQLTMLDEAALTLQGMVVGLRGRGNLGTAKQQNDVLQGIKGDADKLFTTAVVQLYQGHHAPMTSIMLRDLYEILDRIFDRARNTSNFILQIMLKHS